jgi:rhomboid protease GluP
MSPSQPSAGSDSFAQYFAKVLATKGYAQRTVPEARKLAEGGNIVLTKLDGFTISIACIVDAERDPARRFHLQVDEVIEIAHACREEYAGTVNRTKMPAMIEIFEVRNSVAAADLKRLKPLRARFGCIVTSYAVDLSHAAVTVSAWSLLNSRLRLLKRLLSSPRMDDAELVAPPPAALPGLERRPILTFALLAALTAVFVAEQLFPATPATGPLMPSVTTLVALGGLVKTLVLEQREWHRLLTAAFLHAGPLHLIANGLALWMAGIVLEPLLGRAWLTALFLIGALGGSLMSLAINPAEIVSVGASGAIMALLAAATVVTFRLPEGPDRTRVLVSLLRVLVPSLIPLATVRTGARIDFAAHAGGALIGGLSGGAILTLWPRAAPGPRLHGGAVALALLGVAALGWSGYQARAGYASYALERLLIPPDQVPKTEAELVSSASRLVSAYPRDPRSRLFSAMAKLRARDSAGAEAELRTALGEKEILRTHFKRELEVMIRTLLARMLMDQNRVEAARLEAKPVCDAGPGQSVPEELKGMKLCL